MPAGWAPRSASRCNACDRTDRSQRRAHDRHPPSCSPAKHAPECHSLVRKGQGSDFQCGAKAYFTRNTRRGKRNRGRTPLPSPLPAHRYRERQGGAKSRSARYEEPRPPLATWRMPPATGSARRRCSCPTLLQAAASATRRSRRLLQARRARPPAFSRTSTPASRSVPISRSARTTAAAHA